MVGTSRRSQFEVLVAVFTVLWRLRWTSRFLVFHIPSIWGQAPVQPADEQQRWIKHPPSCSLQINNNPDGLSGQKEVYFVQTARFFCPVRFGCRCSSGFCSGGSGGTASSRQSKAADPRLGLVALTPNRVLIPENLPRWRRDTQLFTCRGNNRRPAGKTRQNPIKAQVSSLSQTCKSSTSRLFKDGIIYRRATLTSS